MTCWALELEPPVSNDTLFVLHLCYSAQVFTMCPNCPGRQIASKGPQSGWDTSILTTLFFSTSHFSDLSTPKFPHRFPLLLSPSLYSFTFGRPKICSEHLEEQGVICISGKVWVDWEMMMNSCIFCNCYVSLHLFEDLKHLYFPTYFLNRKEVLSSLRTLQFAW